MESRLKDCADTDLDRLVDAEEPILLQAAESQLGPSKKAEQYYKTPCKSYWHLRTRAVDAFDFQDRECVLARAIVDVDKAIAFLDLSAARLARDAKFGYLSIILAHFIKRAIPYTQEQTMLHVPVVLTKFEDTKTGQHWWLSGIDELGDVPDLRVCAHVHRDVQLGIKRCWIGKQPCFYGALVDAILAPSTTLEEVLEMARDEFPLFDWTAKARHVPTRQWLDSYLRVLGAAGNETAVRAIDSHIVKVLRGRMAFSVVKTDKDRYEVFTDGKWNCGVTHNDFIDYSLEELKAAFGSIDYNPILKIEHYEVPRPFESIGFAGSMANYMLQLTPRDDQIWPLDIDNHHRLLDNKGNVIDYAAGGIIRKARAEERLYRHIPWTIIEHPLTPLLAAFGQLLHDKFAAKVTDLKEDDQVMTAFEEIKNHADAPMSRAVFECWGDLNDFVYFMRFASCMLIGKPEVVQMLGLTGPQNCGKSFLALCVVAVLGQASSNLCQVLPSNYLTRPPRDDAEASKPVLAQCRGCKCVTPKEQVAEELRPVTLKTFVAGPDVNVSARHNNNGKDDETSFPITWKVLTQGNSDLRYSRKADDGLAGKVVEMRPPNAFLGEDEFDNNNLRHRHANNNLSSAAAKGAFVPEMLAWSRALACTLQQPICDGRNILPVPPAYVSISNDEKQAIAMETAGLKHYLLKYTTYCKELTTTEKKKGTSEQKPTEYMELKRVIHRLAGGTFDQTEWTDANFGSTSSFKAKWRKKNEGFDYFKTQLPQDDSTDRRPIRLKTQEELAADTEAARVAIAAAAH